MRERDEVGVWHGESILTFTINICGLDSSHENYEY